MPSGPPLKVLVAGGRGFIGSYVQPLLSQSGCQLIQLSRRGGRGKMSWIDVENFGIPECDAVVNLCGYNILKPFTRLNDFYRRDIWESRVAKTSLLGSCIENLNKKPKVFVSMSGVAIYKPDPEKEWTEESEVQGYDYMSGLVEEWETAGKLHPELGVRSVALRSGVVLGRGGGLIQRQYLPFFFGLGGPIGSGKQWFPWIHAADVAGIIKFAIDNDHVDGVLNAVAPDPITNAQFAKAFGKALNRPAVLPFPSIGMKLIFGSERAVMVLEGQKVIPKKTLEVGYKFFFPTIESACKNCAKLTR